MIAIAKHAKSIFAQPPMPYLRLRRKMRSPCRKVAPASQTAMVLPLAKRVAVESAAIISNTSRVVRCGFALPRTMACAYTNGEISASVLLRKMKRMDISCVSSNRLPFLVKSSLEERDPDPVSDPCE